MRTPYEIIDRPVITEKTTIGQALAQPQYTFKVAIDANKFEIKTAIEAAFNVKVLKVNTQRIKGKVKRVRTHPGKRADWKKAVITLAAGQTINLY